MLTFGDLEVRPEAGEIRLHFDAEASMKSEVRDGRYKVTIRVPYITAPT